MGSKKGFMRGYFKPTLLHHYQELICVRNDANSEGGEGEIYFAALIFPGCKTTFNFWIYFNNLKLTDKAIEIMMKM